MARKACEMRKAADAAGKSVQGDAALTIHDALEESLGTYCT